MVEAGVYAKWKCKMHTVEIDNIDKTLIEYE